MTRMRWHQLNHITCISLQSDYRLAYLYRQNALPNSRVKAQKAIVIIINLAMSVYSCICKTILNFC